MLSESGWMLVYEELPMCKGLWACDMHHKAVFQGLCMRAGSCVTRQSAPAHTLMWFLPGGCREKGCALDVLPGLHAVWQGRCQ